MVKVLWVNFKILFGNVIKIILIFPLLLLCLSSFLLIRLDRLICYLWKSADDMIENSYVENIYGK